MQLKLWTIVIVAGTHDRNSSLRLWIFQHTRRNQAPPGQFEVACGVSAASF
jgi:hypothetical protein